MDEPRLKAKLRVQAMLRQAQVGGGFGAVLRPGDSDAGAILAILRGRAGLSAWTETRTAGGAAGWMRGAAGDQAGIDAYVARAVARDPDVWVVEFEGDGAGLPFGGGGAWTP